MRRDSRIHAFTLVFERLFNSQPFDDELWQQIKDKDKPFAEQIFGEFEAHKDEIRSQIEKAIVGYSLDRVHSIDLALMYVAVAEMQYCGTPAPVVINETIEIAKAYSSEDAPKFINGVLSTIVKERK